MKTTKPELKVTKNAEKPEPDEVIAQAIIDLSEGMKRLNNSRLTKRTIILLLRDATGLGKREIERLMEVLPQLESMYLK